MSHRTLRSGTVASVSDNISDNIIEYMDIRFKDLENSISNNLLSKIKEEISLAVAELLKVQNEKIVQLESSVAILQSHVTSLKEENIKLAKHSEENEQYGRRLCVRVGGIEYDESRSETADQVLENVKSKWEQADVVVPDSVIDRAHRVGMPYNDRVTGAKCQDVIVRFPTFRHRTMVYRKRKSMEGVTVRLDLTKQRYDLLKEARKLVDGHPNVKFVYADINCRLKVKFNEGIDQFFESMEKLNSLLN